MSTLAPTAATPARGEWAQSWPVVLGSAIGLATGYSVWAYVSSTFVLPLNEAFGWSRGSISSVAATGLLGAAIAPFFGGMVDRVGVRPVLLASTTIMGLFYLALSFMNGSLVLFYALFTFLGMAGLGTIGITYTRAIASWFSKSRGLALGMALMGVSIAALILPPVLSAAMAQYGWAVGFQIMAGCALLIGLPAAYFLVRERPREVAERISTPWRMIVKMPVFWLLILAILLVNIPGAGILGQFQPIMVDSGLSRESAAFMLSIYAGAVFVGRIGFGVLLDRVSPSLVAATAFALPAIGVLFMIDGQVSQLEAGFIAGLLGIAAGAEIDIMGFFVARYFGLRHYSSLFGAMMSALVVANGTGNVLYGKAFDALGDYSQVLVWSVGGYIVSAALMLWVGRIAPQPLDESSATAPVGLPQP